MSTADEPIMELVKRYGFLRYQESGEADEILSTIEAAIRGLRARAERAEASLKRVQSSALMLADASAQTSSARLREAARLHAETRPDALDSERSMNAQLTEENDRLEKRIAALEAENAALMVARDAALRACRLALAAINECAPCMEEECRQEQTEIVAIAEKTLRAAIDEAMK